MLHYYYINLADALGANKTMVTLIKAGKVKADAAELAAYESGVKYGERQLAKAIADGNITRLDALQAEKRGGDSVRKEYAA